MPGTPSWATCFAPAYADQPGTICFEQTGDGQHFDLSTDYAVEPGGKAFSEPVFLPFVRVRYVNGPTPQSEFRTP